MTSTTISISLSNISIYKIPFIIALEQGIYAKNGLSIEHFIPSVAAKKARHNSITVNPQFVKPGRGKNISTGGGIPTIYDRTTNVIGLSWEGVIIATMDHGVGWHIVSKKEIDKVEKLKGKRLGYSYPGRVAHFIALHLSQRMGWDPIRDISLFSQATLASLSSDLVDALVVHEVVHVMSQSMGFKTLVSLQPWNLPIVGSGVSVNRSWLRENRQTVRRFIKSLIMAIAMMKNNRHLVFDAMAKWYNITDPKQQELIYASVGEMPRKPYPAIEGIKKMMETYYSHEMAKHKPENFYDDSLVRDLDESGFIDPLYR